MDRHWRAKNGPAGWSITDGQVDLGTSRQEETGSHWACTSLQIHQGLAAPFSLARRMALIGHQIALIETNKQTKNPPMPITNLYSRDGSAC